MARYGRSRSLKVIETDTNRQFYHSTSLWTKTANPMFSYLDAIPRCDGRKEFPPNTPRDAFRARAVKSCRSIRPTKNYCTSIQNYSFCGLQQL